MEPWEFNFGRFASVINRLVDDGFTDAARIGLDAIFMEPWEFNFGRFASVITRLVDAFFTDAARIGLVAIFIEPCIKSSADRFDCKKVYK